MSRMNRPGQTRYLHDVHDIHVRDNGTRRLVVKVCRGGGLATEMSSEDPQLCPGGRELIAEAQAVLANAQTVREMLRRSGEDPSTVRPAWLADLAETRWTDEHEK